MPANAADCVVYPVKAASRDVYVFRLRATIAAVGAPSLAYADDPQLTLTRTGVGVYTLTYPAGQEVFITAQLLAADATPTAASFVTTAENPQAGTATLQATNGTAAAEIEAGSTLKVQIAVSSRAP